MSVVDNDSSVEFTKNYISYGDQKIHYQRVSRSESIQRVKIKVYPDCRVEVAAPMFASDEEVKASVELKARWIFKKIEIFRAQLEGITPRKYVSGETHYYLGKQYQLKVDVSEFVPQGVKLLRGVLQVNVAEKKTSHIKKYLNDWYRIRAREVFSKRMDALLEQTLWVSETPSIRILAMKTQWGSCSPAGMVTLNPMLVKSPRDCIDYVILHELCHIAEHNHGDKFYRLMDQVMPNWEQTKSRLDFMASHYI